MNTSVRKQLGASLFLGGIALALWAERLGYGFLGYASGRSPMVVWFDLSIHWPVLPASALAVAGLLCWILPLRRDGQKRAGLERSLVVSMIVCLVLGLLQIGFPLRCYLEGRFRPPFNVNWNDIDSVRFWVEQQRLHMVLYWLTPLSGTMFLSISFIIWNYRRKMKTLKNSGDHDT